MSIFDPVAHNFAVWARAELAAHYAAPCPDHIMVGLVDHADEAQKALCAAPALTCEHLVLKLFPIFLAVFEPKQDDHPLVPVFDEGYSADGADFAAIMADFERLVPAIRDAMSPANWTRERAA